MNQEVQNENLVETAEETIAAVEETTAEELAVSEPEVEEELDAVEEKPKKKKSKAGKVVLTVVLVIVGLVLVAAIALGIFAYSLFNKATVEMEQPQKVEASSMADFGVRTIKNLFTEDGIILENGDMQMLMDKVTATVSESLKGTPVELRDLYCILEGDQGTIYGKVYITELEVSGINIKLNKELSFSATFDVRYEGESIAAQIKEIKCGDLVIPMSLVSGFASNIQLPEGLSLVDDVIYYDVSGLDKMVDEMLKENTEEDSFGGLLVGLLADETDLTITDADIVDGQLVISGSIF